MTRKDRSKLALLQARISDLLTDPWKQSMGPLFRGDLRAILKLITEDQNREWAAQIHAAKIEGKRISSYLRGQMSPEERRRLDQLAGRP